MNQKEAYEFIKAMEQIIKDLVAVIAAHEQNIQAMQKGMDAMQNELNEIKRPGTVFLQYSTTVDSGYYGTSGKL